jgi:putative pyruvate formate lyase activating enzyme
MWQFTGKIACKCAAELVYYQLQIGYGVRRGYLKQRSKCNFMVFSNIERQIALMEARLSEAKALLSPCRLCPRSCGVDRLNGETGYCRSSTQLVVSSITLHHGEEPPISGNRGSGTIFLTNCNLHCLFCQNYPISQLGTGNSMSVEQVAQGMKLLQERGAHNINWVTPTHVAPMLMEALLMARRQGMYLPVVYNSGGYESLEMLQMWDGIIDIYMPDMKYSEARMARKYSGVPNYPRHNRAAIREMHRQVGDLQIDEQGIAVKGLLVRHLVLPNDLSGTKEILEFLAEKVSPSTYVSLMSQYFPAFHAHKIPELSRPITKKEYGEAVKILNSLHLEQGWVQT